MPLPCGRRSLRWSGPRLRFCRTRPRCFFHDDRRQPPWTRRFVAVGFLLHLSNSVETLSLFCSGLRHTNASLEALHLSSAVAFNSFHQFQYLNNSSASRRVDSQVSKSKMGSQHQNTVIYSTRRCPHLWVLVVQSEDKVSCDKFVCSGVASAHCSSNRRCRVRRVWICFPQPRCHHSIHSS